MKEGRKPEYPEKKKPWRRASENSFALKGKSDTFHLIESLLQSDRLPQCISGIQWNCSVPHWPDFQVHLCCNLLVECDSSQDEDRCGYVRCRHGGFLFYHTCYVIVQPERDIVLYGARQLCETVQGQIATFPFPVDKAFRQFLYERHKVSLYAAHLDLHVFIEIATIAWEIYDVLQPSSGRPEFPSDEQKEDDACRFSLALKVWITSVAEHTHTLICCVSLVSTRKEAR